MMMKQQQQQQQQQGSSSASEARGTEVRGQSVYDGLSPPPPPVSELSASASQSLDDAFESKLKRLLEEERDLLHSFGTPSFRRSGCGSKSSPQSPPPPPPPPAAAMVSSANRADGTDLNRQQQEPERKQQQQQQQREREQVLARHLQIFQGIVPAQSDGRDAAYNGGGERGAAIGSVPGIAATTPSQRLRAVQQASGPKYGPDHHSNGPDFLSPIVPDAADDFSYDIGHASSILLPSNGPAAVRPHGISQNSPPRFRSPSPPPPAAAAERTRPVASARPAHADITEPPGKKKEHRRRRCAINDETTNRPVAAEVGERKPPPPPAAAGGGAAAAAAASSSPCS
eukprot:INCI14363.2.p1 GENE.INCI14363.2~~INCI14363.2.p1  ORF type:complete len:342 (-),score=77.56 INCI14363.2:442-1467(-)